MILFLELKRNGRVIVRVLKNGTNGGYNLDFFQIRLRDERNGNSIIIL